MTITESIKFNKLKEENETLKKELAEKDKEISKLKQDVADLECNQYTLEAKQLYKEDFYKNPYSTGSIDWILVDSSKYDKLSNKDVK
ncbi:hypothetical protein [Spiroplasma endosymbiont of Seladonia tumulorum]|uniref:hypothetical protein n=1 Tax=Spiroplasma endosymbiont of Seladonia tumulorum TaxID=3066321 RepID=UPI0030D0E7E1